MNIPSSGCVSVSGASTTGSTTITTCSSNDTITTNSLSSKNKIIKSKTNVGGSRSGSGILSFGDASGCASASNIDLFMLSCPSSVFSSFISQKNTLCTTTSYASVLSNPPFLIRYALLALLDLPPFTIMVGLFQKQ